MSRFSQNLDLRQSQNLVMSPQLQQAIKMLQLNNIELTEMIDEELAQNPLLEKAEPEADSSEESNKATESDKDKDEVQAEFDEAWTGNEAPGPQDGQGISQDFDGGTAQIGAGGGAGFEDSQGGFEDRLAGETSLRAHLTEQLLIACDDPRDRMVGGLLIDQLDESGYLRLDAGALAAQLGCSEGRVERLLRVMKGFSPTGVFAAGLPECLALQLEEAGTLDAPMRTLLEHLDLLAARENEKLAALCGVNSTYLQDMIEEIRALNPRPASEFDHLVVQTAIPDVLMKRLPNNLGGGWRVELNSETLPRVLVNREYYTQVAGRATSKHDKTYLNEQLSAASWIVRALDQRAQTILKVAGEIVEQQEGFFNYGIEFLRPMTLKDIAVAIDMHESTVSRVTTNKYIGTPRGIFELKFFFTTALVGADGISHSAEAIKARIKTMIDKEDPKKILSDDRLVDLLKAEGIEVARRTVAKYREAMRIGSSIERRRDKRPR